MGMERVTWGRTVTGGGGWSGTGKPTGKPIKAVQSSSRHWEQHVPPAAENFVNLSCQMYKSRPIGRFCGAHSFG